MRILIFESSLFVEDFIIQAFQEAVQLSLMNLFGTFLASDDHPQANCIVYYSASLH